jgi:hypothetical protein
MKARAGDIERVAKAIVEAVRKQGFVKPKVTDEAIQRRIVQLIHATIVGEEELEREAERFAQTHARELVGMDRRKVVLGIKARMAKERNFPL